MANPPIEEAAVRSRPFDPITGLRYLHFAKTAYPELYNELGFDKILAAKGARRWDSEDPGFVAALEEFTRRFLEFLKYHPEAAKELGAISPREMVERVTVEANHYPDDRARELAQKYVREARRRGFAIANEEAVSQALTESLTRAAQKATTAEDLPRQTKEEVAKKAELTNQIEPRVLTEILAERQAEIVSDKDRVSDITRDAFMAGVARPDVYARIETGFLAENPKTNPVVLGKEAERLTNVATALLADFGPEDRDKLAGFFQAFAKTGVQQGLAPAADFALGFFDKEKQRAIADLVTGKAFARAAEPKNLEASLGAAAHSPTITGLKADGQRVFGQPKPIAEHNLIKRWLAAGLTGPIGENLAGKPDQLVTDVFKLATLGVFTDFVSVKPSPGVATQKLTLTSVGRAHAPTATGAAALAWNTLDLYLAAAYQRLPVGFHLDFSAVSGWLLRRGSRELGIKALAGAAVKTGAKGLTAKILGSVLGTAAFPVPVLGTLLGWFGGDVLSRLAGGVLGRIKNFVAGLVGVEGFSFDRDLPLYLAAVAVVALGIFVLPLSFLPFNNVVDKVRSTAFVTSGELGVGGAGAGVYAKADYLNLAGLPKFDLFNTQGVAGVSTNKGPSRPLTPDEEAAVAAAVTSYPQLAVYGRVLADSGKINLTAFSVSGGNFYGYAPSDHRGNIIFYANAFGESFRGRPLARLLAHELAHQVEWFKPEVFDAYFRGTVTTPRAYCGPLGTYVTGVTEVPEETFAEAAAIYLMNQQDPASQKNYLQARCPAGFEFMRSLFSS